MLPEVLALEACLDWHLAFQMSLPPAGFLVSWRREFPAEGVVPSTVGGAS